MYSLNKDVADFNEDGYLEGISDGTATIVAEWGGKIGTATVVVKTIQKLQEVYFEQGVYNMKMGDKRQLEVSTLPENAGFTHLVGNPVIRKWQKWTGMVL